MLPSACSVLNFTPVRGVFSPGANMKKSQRWRRQTAHNDDAAPRPSGAEVGDAAQVSERVPAARLSWNWRGIALDLAVVASNLFLLAPLSRVLRAGGQGFLAPGRDAGWKVSS